MLAGCGLGFDEYVLSLWADLGFAVSELGFTVSALGSAASELGSAASALNVGISTRLGQAVFQRWNKHPA